MERYSDRDVLSSGAVACRCWGGGGGGAENPVAKNPTVVAAAAVGDGTVIEGS